MKNTQILLLLIWSIIFASCADVDSHLESGEIEKAIELCDNTKDPGEQKGCYDKIANYYFETKDFKNALKFYEESENSEKIQESSKMIVASDLIKIAADLTKPDSKISQTNKVSEYLEKDIAPNFTDDKGNTVAHYIVTALAQRHPEYEETYKEAKRIVSENEDKLDKINDRYIISQLPWYTKKMQAANVFDTKYMDASNFLLSLRSKLTGPKAKDISEVYDEYSPFQKFELLVYCFDKKEIENIGEYKGLYEQYIALEEALKKLKHSGADFTVKNKEGKSPIDIASENNLSHVAEILK
jgi:hypothetical protein